MMMSMANENIKELKQYLFTASKKTKLTISISNAMYRDAIFAFCRKCKTTPTCFNKTDVMNAIHTCKLNTCPLHSVRPNSPVSMKVQKLVAHHSHQFRWKQIEWTNIEDRELMERVNRNESVQAIAVGMDRSIFSVRKRMQFLKMLSRMDNVLIDNSSEECAV